MRIIAGIYKGRKLKFPKDKKELRPTKDMVKEALFSIIGNNIEGSAFLDLYAGIGSIGLEALSRGAADVFFVDTNIKYLRKNADLLKIKTNIIKSNTITAIQKFHVQNKKFNIIYLDPPYESDEYDISLKKLLSFDILKTDGLLIVELHSKDKLDELYQFKIVDERKYGDTKLLFLKRK